MSFGLSCKKNTTCQPLGLECIVRLVKTCFWRMIATSITFIIMIAFGLHYNKSLYIAIIDTSVKFIAFFLFDQVWSMIYESNKEYIHNKLCNSSGCCQNKIKDEDIEHNSDIITPSGETIFS